MSGYGRYALLRVTAEEPGRSSTGVKHMPSEPVMGKDHTIVDPSSSSDWSRMYGWMGNNQ